jgi:drug/metabolite transporter (DMT)-like permease
MKRSISGSVLGHEALLLLTAIIWGLAFVAQRAGMESVGPFTFNGIRFILGSASLLPLIFVLKSKKKKESIPSKKNTLISGVLAGMVLFVAASLQQVGMVYTSAGNGGFITSLYVVIVPLMGLFFGLKVNKQTWAGTILAIIGLYFLSINADFSIQLGDSLVLLSAFFFAAHVLIIGYYSNKTDILWLAAVQFAVTGVLSLIIAICAEEIATKNIQDAAIPILYGGIMSVGVAYTLQVVGQQKAIPAHAAIILSLEALFAALGGWLILNETFTTRQFVGGSLMFLGLILSQIQLKRKQVNPY